MTDDSTTDRASSSEETAVWGHLFGSGPRELLMEINASVRFDHRLAQDDVTGSIAHARMLESTGILSSNDVALITSGLENVRAELESGALRLDPRLEDIHMNIENRLRELVGPHAYARLIYDGFWHGPLRRALASFMKETQRTVSGEIGLKLHKGSARVVTRSSRESLYRPDLVTYGSTSTFDQSSAVGFIDIFGLATRIWATSQSVDVTGTQRR